MKSHIIGIPGSGKTTLARWFTNTYRVEAFDLDYVVWGDSGERPPSYIENQLQDIRQLDGWVTEGAYTQEWLGDHLEAADVIVWLDLPLHTSLARIFTRHVRAEFARNNPHPGWRKLWKFLLYIRETGERQRADAARLLAPSMSKVVRCRSSRDVAAYQNRQGPGPQRVG